MAGDWIKVELTTPDKPEVVRMAAALKIDQDAVVGKLFRLWVWADQNSVDGTGVMVTRAFIDRLVTRKGFAQAMMTVGWLAGEDGDLSFPNFMRHNGTSAKARAETNRRVSNHRERQAHAAGNGTSGPAQHPPNGHAASVRDVTHFALQKPLPEKSREEEKREEKNIYSHRTPTCAPVPCTVPAEEDATQGRVPSLMEAMNCASHAGIECDAAEAWWEDCMSRELSANGHFVDRSDREIRQWISDLIAFGNRYELQRQVDMELESERF